MFRETVRPEADRLGMRAPDTLAGRDEASDLPARHLPRALSPDRRGRPRAHPADLLIAEFARSRDPHLREQLILMHERLVRSLAGRFVTPLASQEDLLQVAYLGLIRAIDRFDPGRGARFTAYAVPTIVGEIKRYFRDQGWAVNAPSDLRDLCHSLGKRRRDLERQLGRLPSVRELAEAAGVSEERLMRAMDLSRACAPCSLNDTLYQRDGSPKGLVQDSLGTIDPDLQLIEERDLLRRAIAHLPERQQAVIRLRFFEELSQTEVARRLGVSQTYVSLLERQALRDLRQILAHGH
jgi:RNA polymerase sigma-B factor